MDVASVVFLFFFLFIFPLSEKPRYLGKVDSLINPRCQPVLLYQSSLPRPPSLSHILLYFHASYKTSIPYPRRPSIFSHIS